MYAVLQNCDLFVHINAPQRAHDDEQIPPPGLEPGSLG